MAEKSGSKSNKKAAAGKVSKPTMRELSKTSESKDTKKIRRLKKASGKVGSKVRVFSNFGKKEYHPLKFSEDNRIGQILNKRVRFVPKFFSDAWQEIKFVTWPGNRETYRLTVAVFIFSIIFGIFVALLDFGLDKVFKQLIVKE